MAIHDFISEGEAASLAGVSSQTLRRFAEAGYLHAEADDDGVQLFSRAEVQSLFQVADRTSQEDQRASSPFPSTPPLRAQIEVSSEGAPSASPEPASGENAPAEAPSQNEGVEVGEDVTTHQASEKDASDCKGAEAESPTDQSMFRFEVQRLTHLLALHEKLIDLKDQQVAELHKERDWLRSRIEKLEDKHDRDQLILLSETQMLRRVLVMQEQKKSPWRAALEWFGMSSETKNSPEEPFPLGRTKESAIEVREQDQRKERSQ